ncbi:oxidoreductase [Nemania abortiva]|nr:oxidoreductase [Nemania abortiva]
MAGLDFNLERDVPELTGKNILITGDLHHRAQQVITNIKSTRTQTEAVRIRCDHANLASVKEAAETIFANESRLSVLVTNAGLQFAINHVAHALLIRKLLGLLRKTAEEHGGARIIPVSSLALVLAPRGHGVVFDDLKTTQPYWVLGKWQRYAQSKLANLIYGRELSRRYPEILTLVADPGPSNTGLVSSLGFFDKMIVYLGNINRFLEPDQGHWSQVWLVGVPKDQAKPGELYEPVGKPSDGYTHWCLDSKLAARLWEWTEEELKPWLT